MTLFSSCQDLIDKLQHQVRMYKKQLEEAEDIAANNLAKYKVVQKVGAELHIEIKYFFQF